MKITPKQYAQFLVQEVSEKNEAEIKVVLDDFVKLLAKNNDIKLADEICRQAGILIDQKEGNLDAKVFSAKELGSEAESIKEYLKKETGANIINLENIIDKNILGGMIIKYSDKILDSSYKAKLLQLKQELKK